MPVLSDNMLMAKANATRDSCGNRGAFTLLELLLVMGIMILMMSIVAVNFFQTGSGARRRVAVADVRAALTLARQYAIIHRQKTYVRFYADATNDYYKAYFLDQFGRTNLVREIQYLPPGMVFTGMGMPFQLIFVPDGSIDDKLIKILYINERDKSSLLNETITVNPLTGITTYTPPQPQ